MAQSLGTPTEVQRAFATADELGRDQKAWNLPRASVTKVVPRADDVPLEWEAFLAANFPGSRRHNLKAIVTYGGYRASFVAGKEPASEVAHPDVDARSIEAASVGEWESEGGASQ